MIQRLWRGCLEPYLRKRNQLAAATVGTVGTILWTVIAYDPSATSSFKNDVIFHILAYMSAAKFKASGQAAHMWRTYAPTSEEFDHAIAAVIAMFTDAGGTDRVAKSPAFQARVVEAARSHGASLVPEHEPSSDSSAVPAEGVASEIGTA